MIHTQDPFASVQRQLKQRLAAIPNVGQMTLEDHVLQVLRDVLGPPPPVTGYTIQRDCRFCGGKGCLNCDAVKARVYQEQFPQGPQPIAVFQRANPADMRLLRFLCRADVLQHLWEATWTAAHALCVLEQEERWDMWTSQEEDDPSCA